MSEDKIVSKVRKMMAIANDAGATQGERDNALRMAYATMAKYNIEESDLSEKEVREILEYVGNGSPWARRVANSIAGLFFCNYYSQRGKNLTHKFVGKASNALTAQMMSEYIIKSIKSEAGKISRKEKMTSAWITSFYKGAASIISDRCTELREKQSTEMVSTTGTSIVLSSLYKSEQDANDTFLAEMGIGLRTRASTEHRATMSGFSAGKEFGKGLSLNNQVTSKQLRIGS